MPVALLALTAGATDALSFLGLGGVFSSVMTANLVLLGLSAATHNATEYGGELAAHAGFALAGYLTGALTAGRLLRADPADVAARRLEHARRASTEFGACVLLKGSTTVVAPPHDLDPVLINTTGTSWLATAGTGDVLAGLAGALLAQGLAAPQAALCAAYLHGLAARLAAAGTDRSGRAAAGEGGGEGPIGASDLVAALPAAFRALAP